MTPQDHNAERLREAAILSLAAEAVAVALFLAMIFVWIAIIGTSP